MRPPLILLGGTFDPPHIGHLVLAECARHQFAGSVVFMPAGDPWRKTATEPQTRRVSPADHRLAMTQLAIAGNDAFSVDDRETRRQGPTYTVDTLAELHAEGHDEVILVLGADALDDLPHWREPDRIRTLATLAVAPRAGADTRIEQDVTTIDMPPLAVSATAIRQRVAEGRPVRYLLPVAVEAYIREHGLYR